MDEQRIRVFICEDLEPILRKYQSMITASAEMELVGSATSGAQAIPAVLLSKPDVILMDIEMETAKAGIEASQAIIARLPAARIIILTVHRDDDLIFEAFSAGAIDYIFKNATPVEMLSHIRNAYRNVSSFSPAIAQKMRDELVSMRKNSASMLDMMTRLFRLSPMELEIVELYMHGMTRTEINALRSVSMSTTKSQIHNILAKMECASMQQLVTELIALHLDSFIRRVLSPR